MSNTIVHDNVISVSVQSNTQISSVIKTEHPPVVVVTTGMRGAPGSKPILTINTQIPLSGQRVITMDGNGDLAYADSSNLTHVNRIIGITTSASGINTPAHIALFGEFTEPTWNWDMTKPILLGLNGFLVQDLPVEALFYIMIGKPISPTSILISIQDPYII